MKNNIDNRISEKNKIQFKNNGWTLVNLKLSKQSINNDQNLDESSKKKVMDHIEIILNDTLTIFH